jgi:hypothetical protein
MKARRASMTGSACARNIKVLKRTPEEKPLLQRYTQELNQQENRLEILQKGNIHLDVRIEAAQPALTRPSGNSRPI